MGEPLKRDVSSESVAGDYTLGGIVPVYGQLKNRDQVITTS